MDNNRIANRIIELRQQKGLSQKELGDMLGVSNKAVSKWENGESLPKTATLIKLAELMELDANELIGIPKAESVTDTDEFNRLKAENISLKAKLSSSDSRKRKGFFTVLAVCVIGIIAATLFAVFTESRDNKDIKSIGADGTKIEFCGKTFIPANSLEQYIYSDELNGFRLNDEKYASFVSPDGEKTKALIRCSDYEEKYIQINQRAKTFVYINEQSSRIELTNERISELSLTSGSKFENDNALTDFSDIYFDKYQNGENRIKLIDYLNSLGEPVNKRITDLYVGNKAVTVIVSIETQGIYKTELGEFFKDNDGNTYYYDYITANSYAAGKELSRIVYAEN